MSLDLFSNALRMHCKYLLTLEILEFSEMATLRRLLSYTYI